MQRYHHNVVFAFMVVVFLGAQNASACTTFFLQGDDALLFGRNYDWHIETARVIVNPRGLKKRAFTFEKPAGWTSRFGSVTFNQYGREFPCDGMNEAGLVVAAMWLDGTQYPPIDTRPTVTSLQWIQMQLDTAESVEQVVASLDETRVVSLGAAFLHFLVADAQGDSATIEFIDGQVVVHRGERLPYSALTNTPYAAAVKHIDTYNGFGGSRQIPRSRGSIARFIRGACAVRDASTGEQEYSTDRVFQTLRNVAQGDFTKWSICYDLADREIEFCTQTSPKRKRLSFKELRFDNPDRALSIDIGETEPADVVSRLVPHTQKENQSLVDASFAGTPFLKPWPTSARKMLATYPYTIFERVPLEAVPTTQPVPALAE